jgi:hypothetical protein
MSVKSIILTCTRIFSITILVVFVLAGCTSRYITSNWRPDHVLPGTYDRIMVVAIVPENDSLIRKQIEADLSNSLRHLGYQAVSAYAVFGVKGLSGLGEESTYIKLCSNEIDAVITVAKLSNVARTNVHDNKKYVQASSYYYNRIWNYKTIQSDSLFAVTGAQYHWEIILFDLAALEAACTFTTSTYTIPQELKVATELPAHITKHLLKEKILKRPPVALKAF